jgi:hypothetical protein
MISFLLLTFCFYAHTLQATLQDLKGLAAELFLSAVLDSSPDPIVQRSYLCFDHKPSPPHTPAPASASPSPTSEEPAAAHATPTAAAQGAVQAVRTSRVQPQSVYWSMLWAAEERACVGCGGGAVRC